MMDTKARRDASLGQGTLYFGPRWCPATHREVYHMPGVVTTNHRHYPGTASFPMAHTGNRYVLLEKNGLSDSSRCLLKIHHSEEIAKFHLSSCVHRTIYDCNTISLPHIIQKSSSSFCNITASHTKPAAQTIPDLMNLLREWLELPRS